MTPRRVWALAVRGVLILGAAYMLFEGGRYQAGYSMWAHRTEVEQLRQLSTEQAQTIDELKRQVALLATSSEIDRETYAQLERMLAEREVRLQAQEEELAFYRGIISPPDGQAGLRVQSIEVVPAGGDDRYLLRIVLMQAIAQNGRATGIVRWRLSGSLHGEPAELDLVELTGAAEVAKLDYDFRYFQGLEQEVVLPAGFVPLAAELEVRPSEPPGEPLTQTFEWAALRGPSGE